MRSSRTITLTLFTESHDIDQRPTSILFSLLFHGVAVGLVFFGVLYSPHLNARVIVERYEVRRLDLDMPDEAMPRPAPSKVNYPAPLPTPHPDPSTGESSAMRQIAEARKGAQTLLQPDLAKKLALAEEVPVSTLMVWSPRKVVVKTIVPPQPAKPTAANVTPSPAPPVAQANLADISIATSPVSKPKLAMLPSTTSPIAVRAPLEVQLAPSTITQVSAQPTPAAVLSLSDIHMSHGTVVLPPVNESAASNSEGSLAAGEAKNSGPGRGNHAGNGGAADKAGNGGGPSGNPGSSAAGKGVAFPLAQGSGNGSGNQPTVTKITLPKEGQFGSVVVGASLEDQFPEMTRVWAGRLAYTVYLHVGLARSWILQYSLPSADDAAAAGTIAHLDAPWPYNIVRPNLAYDAPDAETIMVHGYVNREGRFEGLKIVFPPQFPQSPFVLGSLQQWQFRPASRNGQIARVEVLLIIPDQIR